MNLAFSKEERVKNKIILVATLHYLLEFHAEDMVFDDYSPSKQWYLQELKQTEIDIQKYRSKQIKRRLDLHIALLREQYDQGLNAYVKQHTGYDLDIFEPYQADVLPIVSKVSIGHNDVYLIERFLNAYGSNPKEQERVAILTALLAKHTAHLAALYRDEAVVTEKFYAITQGKKSWTVNEAGYEDLRKELDKDWLLAEVIAPNGVDKLLVQFSGKGEYALTYVNICFGGGVGPFCSVAGEKLPIKAYWKDGHTVIVETNADYHWHQKCQQVSRYGEVVKIEYVVKS